MAVKLIADPHGRFEDLPREVGSGDTLIILGDVLDLIDWADISGILPEVVGKDALVGKLMAAAAAGPRAAVELRDELLRPDGDYFALLEERVRESYRRFTATLSRMDCRTYVIYGNGDIPGALAAALDGAGNAVLAPERAEIEGQRFGFVHGALYSPFMMPAEMDDEAYGRRLRELGPVDVLCTHIPPRVEEAVFDVVAGRPVEGSASLLAYVEEHQPAFLYHGHVHQPARRELRIGRTRVVNVGYYKRQGYVHLHRA
ncbi:MAG: metallophosphoesterase family protein [Actinobacteria bacterium]|nr:metallophosphoesterase family protein [Actinomycetota bacterium]MDI6830001.1 metallophosphoesterase [Actinomycetota bacterium]